MNIYENLIIGGGLAGLSASYHLGHKSCYILEANEHLWGLLAARKRNGFTWDYGPHVSFTHNEYVRTKFLESAGEIYEKPVNVGNWFYSNWIRHPAQFNLSQAPESLRNECVQDFLIAQKAHLKEQTITNYREWLDSSLGKKFAEVFAAAYTRKYWTVEPEDMSCDWVGIRMNLPKVEDVIEGANQVRKANFHYIKKIRYPQKGGYQEFSTALAEGAQYALSSEVNFIDLNKHILQIKSGETYRYDRLISTIPLPRFIERCQQSSAKMHEASRKLLCTKVFLVEVELDYLCDRPEHWIYVYDEDMFSTRINFTEKFSPQNAPVQQSGIQVEVYASTQKSLAVPWKKLGKIVLGELKRMGIIKDEKRGVKNVSVTEVPFANVTFLKDTKAQLELIWDGFEKYGLFREEEDTHPMTDWGRKKKQELGSLITAGRFGQWKYYWTDDCLLRGRHIGESLRCLKC